MIVLWWGVVWRDTEEFRRLRNAILTDVVLLWPSRLLVPQSTPACLHPRYQMLKLFPSYQPSQSIRSSQVKLFSHLEHCTPNIEPGTDVYLNTCLFCFFGYIFGTAKKQWWFSLKFTIFFIQGSNPLPSCWETELWIIAKAGSTECICNN